MLRGAEIFDEMIVVVTVLETGGKLERGTVVLRSYASARIGPAIVTWCSKPPPGETLSKEIDASGREARVELQRLMQESIGSLLVHRFAKNYRFEIARLGCTIPDRVTA